MAVIIIADRQIYAGIWYRFVYDEKAEGYRIQLLDGRVERQVRAAGVSFAPLQNLAADCDHDDVMARWVETFPKE